MPKLPTNNTDPISQALDLTPLDNSPRVEEDTNAINDDYNFARANLINTIMKGNEALDGMLDVASMSQHPRGYEVVATIINSLTNANKDLLELSKKKRDLTGEKAPTTINNNLYVGSTAELQKLLNKKDAE